MEPRHEDDAALVRLIDLHLPVWVLVAVDAFPCAPPVARSPRSDFSPGGLCGPDPGAFRCLGATGIDEKDEARAADMFHAVSDRDFRPVPSSVKALNNQAPLMPGHEQMIWIIGIDDGRIETLPISARRHAIVGPAHAAVRGFPETNSGAANAGRIKDWRLSIRTSCNGEPSRSARPGSAMPGIDRAGPCEAIVDRLPNALTMELRKKIRWSCRIGHHGDRPIILAGQHIHQIDPAGRDVGPRPAGRDRRGLGCHGNRRKVRQDAQGNGQGVNNFVHR